MLEKKVAEGWSYNDCSIFRDFFRLEEENLRKILFEILIGHFFGGKLGI